MKEEYEIKFRVGNFEDLLRVFADAGAEPLGSEPETNVLFDTPEGSLHAMGVLLRLRQTAGGVLLTVKQPIACRVVKGRREHETRLDIGLEEAGRLLSALGYRQVMTYGKERESWKLPCGVIACLDTLVVRQVHRTRGR